MENHRLFFVEHFPGSGLSCKNVSGGELTANHLFIRDLKGRGCQEVKPVNLSQALAVAVCCFVEV